MGILGFLTARMFRLEQNGSLAVTGADSATTKERADIRSAAGAEGAADVVFSKPLTSCCPVHTTPQRGQFEVLSHRLYAQSGSKPAVLLRPGFPVRARFAKRTQATKGPTPATARPASGPFCQQANTRDPYAL